jgi:hypothetical protein
MGARRFLRFGAASFFEMPSKSVRQLPSLHREWRERLEKIFTGILVFSDLTGKNSTSGRSADFRTIIDVQYSGRELIRAGIQLALPEPTDLETLKLGCWTLLFLKALFPDWSDAGGWVSEATEWASETGEPVTMELNGFFVVCLYDGTANLLEFDVRKLVGGDK